MAVGRRSRGTLEELTARPCERMELGAGQVRVAVGAVGVNFRDVMLALGMYPGSADLGVEGAGVVVEVGPGVTELSVGDAVMGQLGAAASEAVVDQRIVTRVPAGWSLATAASVPVVFLTALYGLSVLGGLRAGERVLVHAGAGGVGMAAIQLARHWGVKFSPRPAGASGIRCGPWVSTTITSAIPGPWTSRRSSGRSPAATGARRAQLAGRRVPGRVVAADVPGRTVPEMGKTDVRDPQVVAAQHRGVRYQAFDLFEAGPDLMAQMYDEILGLMRAGALKPLPITVFDVRRVQQAYRFVSQARHVGKVVLTVPNGLRARSRRSPVPRW